MSVDQQDQLGSLKQRTLQLGELFDKQQQAQAAIDSWMRRSPQSDHRPPRPGEGWCCSPAAKISLRAQSRFSFVCGASASRPRCQSDEKRRARQQADA